MLKVKQTIKYTWKPLIGFRVPEELTSSLQELADTKIAYALKKGEVSGEFFISLENLGRVVKYKCVWKSYVITKLKVSNEDKNEDDQPKINPISITGLGTPNPK